MRRVIVVLDAITLVRVAILIIDVAIRVLASAIDCVATFSARKWTAELPLDLGTDHPNGSANADAGKARAAAGLVP